MASSRAGCGCDSVMTAVRGSGVLTVSTGANIDLKGWFAFTVSIENATSSEVIGLPSWKVAPSTRLSVTARPSLETDQDLAR